MQHNEAWRYSALLCSPLQPNAHHLTSKRCLQADEAGTAGRQLASTLAAVTALTSAALMPAMALALAASHTRQAIAAVYLASAGLSWAALPVVWTWLAARSGPAADRMQKFVAAAGPVARRRGQAPAQQGEMPCFGGRVCGTCQASMGSTWVAQRAKTLCSAWPKGQVSRLARAVGLCQGVLRQLASQQGHEESQAVS